MWIFLGEVGRRVGGEGRIRFIGRRVRISSRGRVFVSIDGLDSSSKSKSKRRRKFFEKERWGIKREKKRVRRFCGFREIVKGFSIG